MKGEIKMKKNKICLLALAALLFTPAVIQTATIASAEESGEIAVNPADLEKAQIVYAKSPSMNPPRPHRSMPPAPLTV